MAKSLNWSLVVVAAVVVSGAIFASQPSEKTAVYATVINGDHWNLEPISQLVVKSTSIPIPRLAGSSPGWLKEWEDVPPALRRAADEAGTVGSRPLDRALFPPGTKFAANAAVDSIFVPRQGAPESNWELFRGHFEAVGWVAFSDIYFAADKSDALLYYEGRCGSLYGIGAYVWLRRGSDEPVWRIRKRILSWVS